MMALDMTAQLAPVVWGMFGLLIVSAAGVVATALPRARSTEKNVADPRPALRPAAVSA